MHISSLTGIREGELLEGVGKQTKGARMILHKKGAAAGTLLFPPYLSVLDSFVEKKGNFADLQQLSFFSEMSVSEIREYLFKHAVKKEMYISDIPDLQVEVLSLDVGKKTGSAILKIPEKTRNELLFGGDVIIPFSTLYHAIPRKPGSKAARHTLVFRPSQWSVVNQESDQSLEADFFFDLSSGKMPRKLPASYSGLSKKVELENSYAEEEQARVVIQILYEQSDTVPDIQKLSEEISSDSEYEAHRELLLPLLSDFTPGVLKSALQKIIRTGATSVQYHTHKIPGETFLLLCFELLYQHPGAFVPNLRTTVRGSVSALKRLAVTISEDSLVQEPERLTELYVAALLLRSDKQWQPTQQMMRRWLSTAVEALHSLYMYRYNFLDGKKDYFADKAKFSEQYLDYRLLAELRSFHSDVYMLGSTDGISRHTKPAKLLSVMPIEQIIDFHSLTELALFIRDAKYPTYDKLFADIFYYVTGVNPRRLAEKGTYFQTRVAKGHPASYYRTYEEQAFTKQVRAAQRTLMYLKYAAYRESAPDRLSPRAKTVEKDIISLELSDEHLCGMVGQLEFRYEKEPYYVTLDPADIYSYSIMRKPVRGMKDGKVSEKAKADLTAQMRASLLRGIKVRYVSAALPMFRGVTLKLEDDHYVLLGRRAGDKMSWASAKKFTSSYSILGPVEESYEASAQVYPKCLSFQEDRNAFITHLQSYSPQVLARLSMYLASNSSTLEMHKIGRDGLGQDLPVNVIDGEVYWLFTLMCIHFPAMMRRSPTLPTRAFKITDWPLYEAVRKRILAAIRQASQDVVDWQEVLEPLQKGRRLYDYQVRSIERMLRAEKRSTIVNGPTGVGKTSILLGYIRALAERGEMPRYCVYTLPKSAMKSIQAEFAIMGVPCQVIRTTVPGLKKLPRDADGNIVYLQERVVTIIEHDDLRRKERPALTYGIAEYLKEHANDLFFIVDEFHEAMTNSQRSGVVRDVMTVAARFSGMSATIIRDTNVEPLIPYLEEIVQFEVTRSNYWAAIPAIITLQAQVPVNVTDVEEIAPMTDKELSEYRNLLREEGGVREFNQAIAICYQAAERAMLERIGALLKTKRAVFVPCRNREACEQLAAAAVKKGWLKREETHIVSGKSPINFLPDDKGPVRLILTTMRHSLGYNATKATAVVQSIYFSSESSRVQIRGRTIRMGQDSDVTIYTYYCGLLQKIWERYQLVGSMTKAFSGLGELARLELEAS